MTLLHHLGLWYITSYDVLQRIRSGYDSAVEIADDRKQVLVGPDIRLIPPSP